MIRTFDEMRAAHCRPLEGGRAMDDDAVRAQLAELPDWTSDGDGCTDATGSPTTGRRSRSSTRSRTSSIARTITPS